MKINIAINKFVFTRVEGIKITHFLCKKSVANKIEYNVCPLIILMKPSETHHLRFL